MDRLFQTAPTIHVTIGRVEVRATPPPRIPTGDIEWPREVDNDGQLKKDTQGNFIPQALPPHGIEHRYAPLAIVQQKASKPLEVLADLRHAFEPWGKCLEV